MTKYRPFHPVNVQKPVSSIQSTGRTTLMTTYSRISIYTCNHHTTFPVMTRESAAVIDSGVARRLSSADHSPVFADPHGVP